MRKLSGFTLIELMIVVAVIAILAMIAIPAYTDSVAKGRRGEGKATILSAAQGLQRCFTRFNAYDDAGCATATALEGGGLTSENGFYVVTGAVDPTTYTLTATPQGTQAGDDDGCGNLTLDQTGTRGVSGTFAVTKCW